MLNQKDKRRCDWAQSSPLETDYHDHEWGVPIHNDRLLFEMLMLEAMQSGLSWSTVLRKREGYLSVFDNFDACKIAKYNQEKIENLVQDARIIRHRLKIKAIVENAKCFLTIQREFGSFDAYIWSFVDHKPIINGWSSREQVPSSTSKSDAMSKSLKKNGFKYIGSTTCYAYMQGVGMVNDHLESCFRHKEVNRR